MKADADLGAIKSFIKAFPRGFGSAVYLGVCACPAVSCAKRRSWFLAIAFILIAGVDYSTISWAEMLRV